MGIMNQGLLAMTAYVEYTDTTAKSLFTLPRDATPLFAIINVETAFDDSGTDTIKLGVRSDDDMFASGIDVSSAVGQLVAFNSNDQLTRMNEVIATYAGGSSDATAGKARITFVYISPFVSH